MQLKNSFVLFTALTAGSTMARLHGHDRRHAHHDKRGVNDMVYATINGAVVSWINEFSGQGATATAATTEATEAPATPATATVATADAATTEAPVAASTGSDGDWWSTPSDSQFTRAGFGEKTYANGLDYIAYKGNVGSPWGSNIIEVSADKASQYKHVVQFKGSNTDPWTVVFWNKMGPDGKLTGWYGHSALKFTLEPGETRYAAFDDDTQGAWGAAKGENLPTDSFGGYSCTWGEFDFASDGNNGWSGWDVSAIQAQAAGQEVQGMKICTHDNQKCSSVNRNAASVINAYIKSLAGADGIGGNSASGPLRLSAHLDFNDE